MLPSSCQLKGVKKNLDKVVIVEDELMARKGIILTVDWKSMGCIVVAEASNGIEGIKAIKRYKPDIVITDVQMPKMDGIEMIKSVKDTSCARFIILSAYDEFDYARSALRLGVCDYLLKPFRDAELIAAIEKAKNDHTPNDDIIPIEREFLNKYDLSRGSRCKYIEQAHKYIEKHFKDDITIKEVAEHLGLSEGYLSRLFKRHTDYTFVNYLTYYRINKAMKLLKDCRWKVYEVAEQVGYTDATYFSTLFKKLVGVTPSEFQDIC